MIDIEKKLYDKVKSEIAMWNEEGIYAISFFVYANLAFECNGFTNVPIWTISYNTESDCKGAGPLDEERWNYAFWRQNEIDIIDIDEMNEYTKALYAWFEENGIDNIGSEVELYDEDSNYIGMDTCGLYELVGLAANIAKKLQEEGFIYNQFKKTIPIIIHGLEYYDLYFEATEKGNPNGEAEAFMDAMM